MKKYMVTGATGFIGSQLVAALVQRGDMVRAVHRRGSDWHPAVPPCMEWDTPATNPFQSPQVEWIKGDITDRDSLTRAAEGCDGIFHLAACAKNYDPDPQMFTRLNVDGLRNVLEAAKATPSVQRIVWSSSCVTLGPTRTGQILTESEPRITETCFNAYEATKVQAEQLAIQYVQQGVPLVIVNPTRVFGPGFLTESNSVTTLMDEYDRWRMPFLPMFGRKVGNWVLVSDVVRGMMLAERNGRVGERYLLAGDNATLAEFFSEIDRASGKKHLRILLGFYIPLLFACGQLAAAKIFRIHPRITPGWVRMFCEHAAYRCTKAQQELGYQYTPLSEAVDQTWDWIVRVRQLKHSKK
ncbi:MAG: NAD-dependent epimerase/dehydratase family protein [Thermoguttaceae bacterium]|nr:NAD-dependent epimerase/dehydratase family protein [Thermoguttaceae bacterium]